jgi:hypothetical protein
MVDGVRHGAQVRGNRKTAEWFAVLVPNRAAFPASCSGRGLYDVELLRPNLRMSGRRIVKSASKTAHSQ